MCSVTPWSNGLSEILEKVLEAKRAGKLLTLESAQLYFGDGPVPSVRELAEQVGDPSSQRIHLSARSMRDRWLDIALAERRLC